MADTTAFERLRAFATRCVGEARAGGPDVHLEQRGTIRMSAGGRWLPFTAEQRSSIARVSFVWHARVRMAPLITAVVEDSFEDGHGLLDARIFGRIRVAHGEGPELDRGEAQRYLAELPWNPRAILENRALVFGEGEDGSVRVHAGDPRAYVDLFLDDAGDVVRTLTRGRVRSGHGPSPWEGRLEAYEVLGGLRVPRRGTVAWLTPEGRFEYFRGELTGLVEGDST